MTCKDCFHFEVCDSGRHIGEYIDDDGIYSDGVEKECPTFKNKAAYERAIEKLISKKPEIEGDGYDDNGNLIYDTGICPVCREHYEIDYETPKFCKECGQALDWSDTE